MKIDLAAVMRRAGERVRAQDVMGATRLIKEALSGARSEATGTGAPRRRRLALDPAADIAETVGPAEDAAGTIKVAGTGMPKTADTTGQTAAGQAASGQTAAWATRRPRLRRPLGEVMRLLRDGKGALDWGRPGTAALQIELPPGARFEWRQLEGTGGRDYRLYVPSDPARLRGLVVMLHGCKQNPDDFAAGTAMNAVAEREGLVVAYPRQTSRDNAMACWNWFEPGHQRRDAGEPAAIAGIVRALASEFGTRRAMVAGLSAGGAMAAVMGATYPELFEVVGVHSGLPYGAANDVASAFAAMRGERGLGVAGGAPAARLIVFHGDADRTVHPGNAERLVAAAGPGEVRQEAGNAPGGRAFSRQTVIGPRGEVRVEYWSVVGSGHAWSGGTAAGSYTDPAGPDASAEMVRFFLAGA